MHYVGRPGARVEWRCAIRSLVDFAPAGLAGCRLSERFRFRDDAPRGSVRGRVQLVQFDLLARHRQLQLNAGAAGHGGFGLVVVADDGFDVWRGPRRQSALPVHGAIL